MRARGSAHLDAVCLPAGGMKRSPLLPIFLIVLVDILGYTIVLPLLAFYAEHFGASPLVATLLVSVYAFCSLLSAPLLGNLSDRYGRRPLLIISQAGTFAGFVVLGFANSLWLVFLGRILDGITAGNLTIAQAYISDCTPPEKRAKSFAVIGIAFGIGFFIGPAISGELAKYGLHAPFLAAAALSALSMVCTALMLPRVPLMVATAATGAGTPEKNAAPLPAGRRPNPFDFALYVNYFRRPQLGRLLAQFFLFSFAFSSFTSCFGLFAERRFLWQARDVGHLFAFSGFLGILLQGGLIGRLVKRFGEPALAAAGFASAAVAYALLGSAHSVWMLFVAATISTFGNGVLRPVLTSRITQVVGREEQGTALGIAQSLGSIAMMLAPPIGGTLIGGDHLTAWGGVAAGIAGCGLLIARLQQVSGRNEKPGQSG